MTKKNLSLGSQINTIFFLFISTRSTHMVPNETQISERSAPLEASSTKKPGFWKLIPSFNDFRSIASAALTQMQMPNQFHWISIGEKKRKRGELRLAGGGKYTIANPNQIVEGTSEVNSGLLKFLPPNTWKLIQLVDMFITSCVYKCGASLATGSQADLFLYIFLSPCWALTVNQVFTVHYPTESS